MLKTKMRQWHPKRIIQSTWFFNKLKHISRRPKKFSSGQPTVIGFMSSPTGLGYGARLIFNALEEKAYRPNAIDVSNFFYPETDTPISFVSNGEMGDGPLIFHINGPELLFAMNSLNSERIKNQKIIAVWAWEQRTLPNAWLKVESFVDEIWASSHFLENTFRENLKTPVYYTPYPVAALSPISIKQPPPNPNIFRIYTSFDPKSGLERKNPEAVIETFRQAFEDNNAIELTIRVPDPDWPIPESWKALKNVKISNSIVSDGDIDRDLAHHDCVISLHRCEGFGFLIARALALGLPTIFTEGFGSDDFSNCPGAFTVKGENYTIQNEDSVYERKHGQWLDPDINQARLHLQKLSRLPASVHIETAHQSHLWWETHYGTDNFINKIPNDTKNLFI